MTSKYTELYGKAIECLGRHSLAELVTAMGLDEAKVHSFVADHPVLLASITTFDQGLAIANAILSKKGLSVKIESMITNKADLKLLYDIGIEWRDYKQ